MLKLRGKRGNARKNSTGEGMGGRRKLTVHIHATEEALPKETQIQGTKEAQTR